MKKTVKGLIIAASVAAVVGVGAVSYAAWAGNATTANVTTSTGSLETYGVSVKTDGLDGKVWVPFDQDLDTYAITNGVNVWDIEVEFPGEADSNKNYTLQINFVAADTTDAMENCMYVFKGTTYTAPTKTTVINFDTTTDWQQITPTATDIANFTVGTDTHVYVIFNSNVRAQMNNNVKLVLTLANADKA